MLTFLGITLMVLVYLALGCLAIDRIVLQETPNEFYLENPLNPLIYMVSWPAWSLFYVYIVFFNLKGR